ncbi:MAG: hypothetical protein WBZ36_25740 [Candidatus Nitrosopolaris sp.]
MSKLILSDEIAHGKVTKLLNLNLIAWVIFDFDLMSSFSSNGDTETRRAISLS